ncbi:MAG TPA: undecaprenyl-diphosphatase [Leptospiraceae bacterium]|nr:undecaprenyl-diphosphatase [Spirochaetaceae bacterium]HBS05777.1 undecaprenyl-diphosphatase [Leptospiraceae bacterium]|tara:strand:- start:33844 stop:34704 length:861 start_codon:yes stop_codon:yes gene_type:complete
MIDNQTAVILGLVQGLAEFIPISSTAHLRIIPAFMQLKDPGAAYSAVLQLGTLLSLIVYFRKDLGEFIVATYRSLFPGEGKRLDFAQFRDWDLDARMPYYLIIGTIPVSVFGLVLKDFIVGPFRSLYVISGSLIVLALFLWWADRIGKKERTVSSITMLDAFWIGMAQALALVPGASRSGTTLMMGLFLGLTRQGSMRFSFLLSIPAIGLSGVYELIKDFDELQSLGLEGLLLGTIVAGLSGYIAVAGLLRYLRTHSTFIFVAYRILLGILILVLLGAGWIMDNPA